MKLSKRTGSNFRDCWWRLSTPHWRKVQLASQIKKEGDLITAEEKSEKSNRWPKLHFSQRGKKRKRELRFFSPNNDCLFQSAGRLIGGSLITIFFWRLSGSFCKVKRKASFFHFFKNTAFQLGNAVKSPNWKPMEETVQPQNVVVRSTTRTHHRKYVKLYTNDANNSVGISTLHSFPFSLTKFSLLCSPYKCETARKHLAKTHVSS